MGLFSKNDKQKGEVAVSGKYFGSHPELPEKMNIRIAGTEQGILIYKGKNLLRLFKWEEVIDFQTSKEIQQNSSSRITASRMLTLGVFSLAAPKKTGSIKGSSVDILYTTTGTVELHSAISGGASGSLSGSMANYAIVVREKDANTLSALVKRLAKGESKSNERLDNADLIMKYETLRQNGVITQAEFDKKKEELLNS